jgi:hypothetical protein
VRGTPVHTSVPTLDSALMLHLSSSLLDRQGNVSMETTSCPCKQSLTLGLSLGGIQSLRALPTGTEAIRPSWGRVAGILASRVITHDRPIRKDDKNSISQSLHQPHFIIRLLGRGKEALVEHFLPSPRLSHPSLTHRARPLYY